MLFLFLQLALNALEVPSEAKELLDSLPEKSITLPLVIEKAIANSDAYKILRAQKQGVGLSYQYGLAPYDWQLEASFGINKDKQQAASPSVPSNLESESYLLETKKYFSSGTSLSLGLNHGSQMFEVINTKIPEYYETSLEVGISQSLLKDSFGYASRRLLQASQSESEASKYAYEHELQNWYKQTSELYYTIWLAQAQVQSLRTSTSLRKRLLEISKRKLARGTTEQTDFLQIEAAYLENQAQLIAAEQDLQNYWQKLIILVKLPAHWIQIDANLIPMKLDAPEVMANEICQSESAAINLVLKDLEKKSKAENLKYEASKNSSLADIKLNASYATNAVANQEGRTLSDISELDHNQWYVGLSLTYPLSNTKAKAEELSAYVSRSISEARYADEKANYRIDKLSKCKNLAIQTKVKNFKQIIVNKQKRRASLEEKRFAIGKSNVQQMVQAGDDYSRADLSYNQSQLNLKMAAWEVILFSSKATDYLASLGVTAQ